MSVLEKFGDISGLKLNRKKTNALWIGSFKNNKTKPFKINVLADPIKVLRTYISHDCDKNNNLNLFLKIQCNYSTKKSDKSVPLFYLEMLDYFKELGQVPVKQDSYESDLILWNNQDITIDSLRCRRN